jgi:hypothetical protein
VVTAARSGDPIVALNQVLDEVLDLLLEVRQADRKVPPAHELHGELDRHAGDLASWRTLLADEDIALGVSPLSFIPSAAGSNHTQSVGGHADRRRGLTARR